MQPPFDVLILSDNLTFRDLAESSVTALNNVRLCASDGCDASAAGHIRIHHPHLVILEVSNSEDNALRILNEIQTGNVDGTWGRNIHTLLVSRFTPGVVSILPGAIESGCFEHVLRPPDDASDASGLRRSLQLKIAAELKRQNGQGLTHTLRGVSLPESSLPQWRAEAILIGCSTGGPQALSVLLPKLCSETTVPILIVQHIQDCFTKSLASALDAKCQYTVKEAEDGEAVLQRHAYIAPGGCHMCLKRNGTSPVIDLDDSPIELGCRPSVNMLFRSAPKVFGSRLVAAILTGMGKDGTEGAAVLKRAHASVYAQDEASSVVWGMPGNALKEKVVDGIYPLEGLVEVMAQCTREETD